MKEKKHNLPKLKGKVFNRTQKYYADGPEGAEFLVYEGEDVPEGVTISKNNVCYGLGSPDKLRVKRIPAMWGWSDEGGFCNNFDTPQEAIEDYLKLTKKGVHKYFKEFCDKDCGEDESATK